MGDGVLEDEPGSVRAVLPDEAAARPAMVRNDFGEANRISVVNFFPGMVTVAYRAVGHELGL
jgi:hypothetical protein